MTLQQALTTQNLRGYTNLRVYNRGLRYYRSRRVRVLSADQREAKCIVRGTHDYEVAFELRGNTVHVSCSCPFFARGAICKHIVAAALAVADQLERQQAIPWHERLAGLLAGAPAVARTRQASLWLFVSLQHDFSEWSLVPYQLQLGQVPDVELPSDPETLADQFPRLLEEGQIPPTAVSPLQRAPALDKCLQTSWGDVALADVLRYQRSVQSYAAYYYPYGATVSMGRLLALLAKSGLALFLGSRENPAHRRLHILSEPVELSLHIAHDKAGIRITLTPEGREGIWSQEEAKPYLLSSRPTPWVLMGSYVFPLAPGADGGRVLPWLENPSAEVPAEEQERFLDEFLPTLAQTFPIKGADITWEDVHAEPVKRLYLIEEEGTLQAHLRFGYGPAEVVYEKGLPPLTIQRKPDSWVIQRIHRDPQYEEEAWRQVSSAAHGLKRSGRGYAPHVFLLRTRVHPVDFLMRCVPRLTQSGFEIYGEEDLKLARVNRHTPTLSLNVSSGIDWFDLQAVVQFGDVQASLQDVRRAIKRKERYVKLADGSIGEIPQEWIQRYKHLFGLGEQTEDGLRFSQHHLTLLDQLLAEADRVQLDAEFQERKRRLLEFEGIQSHPLPAGFRGELRPYQKAAFDWLHFLHEYGFGGCLADDMGLGKTIETLAFLLSLKEAQASERASLLVLPRSLLVNWQREIERFAPALTFYLHFGPGRSKDVQRFEGYDLVLTTYGTMLRDIEQLRQYRFHYAILDESQAIKNPLAKTSKAARLLNADHRLVLTGTPVENTTFELWSQFAFLNPGLLGNLEYFRQEFSNPIERQGDEASAQFLRKMVYPFILRRTKEQVAPELPPRTERIVYTDMSPAQRRFYQSTRDKYRARLLGLIEEQGLNKARMQVLEGLLRLRQICNHPRLVRQTFRGDSAKLELLLKTLETLQSEGHKVLVFSQFVQMLKIIREELEQREMPYVYLDGRTRKRQERVDTFQNDPSIPFFLISLKAGGVGLNLTAADYVIHVDPWWNPAVEMQASDRTHRIGQDKPVFIYKLITRDSVEEKILRLQERKKALVQQLVTTEASFFKSLTADDVRVLFS